MMHKQSDTDTLPAGSVLPDYAGGSILNLMASIAAALGSEPRYACVPGLDACRPARRIVLLVIDGLGLTRLRQVAPAGFLAEHCLQGLTSVVPSATAAAIPVFMSGAAPAQHGFPGWFVWFREMSLSAAILPFATRSGFVALDHSGWRPQDLSGAAPFADQLAVPVCHVAPARIADSVFSRDFLGQGAVTRRFDDFDGLCEASVQAVRDFDDGGFVYSYWPDYDHQCHLSGVNSEAADRHLLKLDEAVAALAAQLAEEGADLLVTADHGFTDCPDDKQFVLARDFPEVADCLQFALTGEPRLPIAHLRPGCEGRFLDEVEARLGAHLSLMPSSEALAQGWFGPGDVYPPLRERLGDYLLLMAPHTALFDPDPHQPLPQMRGFHGGLSAEEMYVPLVYCPAS
ncbi:alkaline phosphatase family protein [Granulosicoccaceae sp. 1_MG-2023]|nr:alkaline phosphatase family protein [Granulosicoccaceae sp. 1_MG-2023]